MKHCAAYRLLLVAALTLTCCVTTQAQSPAPTATPSSGELFSPAEVRRLAEGLRRGNQAIRQLGLAGAVIDSLKKENALLARNFELSRKAAAGYLQQADALSLLYLDEQADHRQTKRVLVRRTAGGLLLTVVAAVGGILLGPYIAR